MDYDIKSCSDENGSEYEEYSNNSHDQFDPHNSNTLGFRGFAGNG